METKFTNTENSKTNESHKFVLNLSYSSSKHVDLQNLPFYQMWKNITKQYKSNKLQIIAPK